MVAHLCMPFHIHQCHKSGSQRVDNVFVVINNYLVHFRLPLWQHFVGVQSAQRTQVQVPRITSPAKRFELRELGRTWMAQRWLWRCRWQAGSQASNESKFSSKASKHSDPSRHFPRACQSLVLSMGHKPMSWISLIISLKLFSCINYCFTFGRYQGMQSSFFSASKMAHSSIQLLKVYFS